MKKLRTYIEFNTLVESQGKQGWLNIAHWGSGSDGVSFERNEKTTTFRMPFLEISLTAVGIAGGCSAEKDNNGCFFLG